MSTYPDTARTSSEPNTIGRSRDLTGRTTVAGLFRDRDAAERAVRDLERAGFDRERIGIAMRDRTAQGQLVEDTGTHAATGAVSGALGGGLLGGLVGLLLGIGAIAIPGIGPLVAGGALAAALGVAGGTAAAGAGIGAAAGGVLGALVGMGIPEKEARHFEQGVRAGGVLVTVEAGNRAAEALDILERNGADTGAEAANEAADEAARGETPAALAGTDGTRSDASAPATGGVVGAAPAYVASREVREVETAMPRSQADPQRTGTSDLTYDLVSVIYHALQGVDTYEGYVADAERAGDRELARFLRDVQDESRRRAQRAKELLHERLAADAQLRGDGWAQDDRARAGQARENQRPRDPQVRDPQLREDERTRAGR